MGTGAGIVTEGMCVPAMSVNCMRNCVTTTPDAPPEFTTTPKGMLNGATVGQNALPTGCATMLSDSALIDMFADDEGDDPAVPNVVGVVGRFESLHDAKSAAINESASVR